MTVKLLTMGCVYSDIRHPYEHHYGALLYAVLTEATVGKCRGKTLHEHSVLQDRHSKHTCDKGYQLRSPNNTDIFGTTQYHTMHSKACQKSTSILL